jgi:hypothetical protein
MKMLMATNPPNVLIQTAGERTVINLKSDLEICGIMVTKIKKNHKFKYLISIFNSLSIDAILYQ